MPLIVLIIENVTALNGNAMIGEGDFAEIHYVFVRSDGRSLTYHYVNAMQVSVSANVKRIIGAHGEAPGSSESFAWRSFIVWEIFTWAHRLDYNGRKERSECGSWIQRRRGTEKSAVC